MSKFSAKEKLDAVNRAINGRESYLSIAKSMGVDDKAIHKWVKQFEYNGVEAFIKSYTNYTPQFKLDVLNYMIEHGTSLIETSAIFRIAAPPRLFSGENNLKQKDSIPFNQRKRGIHP